MIDWKHSKLITRWKTLHSVLLHPAAGQHFEERRTWEAKSASVKRIEPAETCDLSSVNPPRSLLAGAQSIDAELSFTDFTELNEALSWKQTLCQRCPATPCGQFLALVP